MKKIVSFNPTPLQFSIMFGALRGFNFEIVFALIKASKEGVNK